MSKLDPDTVKFLQAAKKAIPEDDPVMAAIDARLAAAQPREPTPKYDGPTAGDYANSAWESAKDVGKSIGKYAAPMLLGPLTMPLGPLASKELADDPNFKQGLGKVGEAIEGAAGMARGAARALYPSAVAATPPTAEAAEPVAPVAPGLEAFRQPAAAQAPLQPENSLAAPGVTTFRPFPGGAVGPAPEGSKEWKMQEQAFAAQQKAMERGALVGQERAAEEYTLAQEQMKNAATLDAQRTEAQGQYQREREAQVKTLQKMTQDYAKSEVDPGRFWGSRSTEQKMMAGIGMLLGVFGAPASGGGNAGAEALTKLIDRDIDLQKAARAEKGQAIGKQQNLLDIMRANWGDDVQAQAATKLAQLEVAQSKIDMLRTKFAGPEHQAKFEAATAALMGERTKAFGDFMRRTEEMGLKRAHQRLEQQQLGLEAMKVGMSGKTAGRELPASEAAQVGDFKDARSALKDLWSAWQEKTGPLSGATQHLPGTSAAQYMDRIKVAAQSIGRTLEGGKMTDADLPRYFEMLPAPGDSKERAEGKVLALEARIKSAERARVTSLNSAGFNMSGFKEEYAPTSFKKK